VRLEFWERIAPPLEVSVPRYEKRELVMLNFEFLINRALNPFVNRELLISPDAQVSHLIIWSGMFMKIELLMVSAPS